MTPHPQPLSEEELAAIEAEHERYTDSDECMACDLSLLAASECRVPQLVAAIRDQAARLVEAEAYITTLQAFADCQLHSQTSAVHGEARLPRAGEPEGAGGETT